MTATVDRARSRFARLVAECPETSTYRVDLGPNRATGRLSNRLEAVGSDRLHSATLFEPGDGESCIEIEQSFRMVEGQIRADDYVETTFDRGEVLARTQANFGTGRLAQASGRIASTSKTIVPLFGIFTLLRDIDLRAGLSVDVLLWVGASLAYPASVRVGRRAVIDCGGLKTEAWPVRVRPHMPEIDSPIDSAVAGMLPELVLAFDASGSHRLLTMEFPVGPLRSGLGGRVELEAKCF
ncbi:hypothetical protein [Gordonia sp. MP11Mi]|uniref:Uncharacterized protein n=1 Tax=Gordonia sp. MP11Mi TaxID=3022769 RepID=A0AA97CXE6_9ACTN